MDTKPMSQVLKTAPEVTSLSATDRVLITDANGEPKRIGRNAITHKLISLGVDSPQWIRLFSIGNRAALFFLHKNFYTSGGGSVLVHINITKDDLSYCSINVLSKLLNVKTQDPFGKIRILVAPSGVAYVDYYYPITGYNDLTFASVVSDGGLEALMTPNATIPSGYTAKEYSLSLSGGG